VLDDQTLLLGDARIRNASVENLNLILQHTYWWPNGEAGIYPTSRTEAFEMTNLKNSGIAGGGFMYTDLIGKVRTEILVRY
jgi:hypothetical protein